MTTIRTERLSKRYRIVKGAGRLPSVLPAIFAGSRAEAPRETKEIWALRDVDLEVSAGSIVGVIGANGAGKSTLLKVLARISPPTAGRALVRGRVIPLLEVGAAFQPDATGRENVLLNAALYGIPRQDALRRMDAIVDFAGIPDFLDTPVKRYSSGMYVRLAFSTAVNMEPNVLLADEVLAVGDLEFQARCVQRVEEAARQEGMTVLYVSHDLATVRRLCDRVVWLNGGQIVADGAPDDVVEDYEQSAWALLGRKDDRGEHVTEAAEIVDTRLIGPEGAEVATVSVAEPVIVRVRLSVHRPRVGFRCLLVFEADGVEAFRAVQPEAVSAGAPGAYSVDVTIPPHLLNDTVYTVKASFWIVVDGQERRDLSPVHRHALTFRVYDTDEKTSARGSYTGPLAGVLRPKLDWRTDRG
jgi:lipopolysaccharide transport system ATP-binding protein